MRERVILEAILLPDRRIGTAVGVPMRGSRWHIMGCTGARRDDICFVVARIDGERWYARVSPGTLAEGETGPIVTLERFLKHSAVRARGTGCPTRSSR